MVKVIIVNGMPGCGKTTFEQFCIEALEKNHAGVGIMRSSVDYVKEVARHCGWNGTKLPEDRLFLSELKRALSQWRDLPFRDIVNEAARYAADLNHYVLFVDCREPNEIERLKKELNAFTVLVRRPDVEGAEASNSSDANVLEYDYDLTIWNEFGVEELYTMADYFVTETLKGVEYYGYEN